MNMYSMYTSTTTIGTNRTQYEHISSGFRSIVIGGKSYSFIYAVGSTLTYNIRFC